MRGALFARCAWQVRSVGAVCGLGLDGWMGRPVAVGLPLPFVGWQAVAGLAACLGRQVVVGFPFLLLEVSRLAGWSP